MSDATSNLRRALEIAEQIEELQEELSSILSDVTENIGTKSSSAVPAHIRAMVSPTKVKTPPMPTRLPASAYEVPAHIRAMVGNPNAGKSTITTLKKK